MNRLINQLPKDTSRSRFALAKAEDDELADMIVDDVPEASAIPPLEGWGTVASVVAVVADRLSETIATIATTSGNKAPKIKPIPRPMTALDRAKRRRSRARMNALVDEVTQAQANRKSRSQ